MESKTIEEIRDALTKKAWNVNHNREGVMPLLVVYPNEILLELFGKEAMEQYWITDKKE